MKKFLSMLLALALSLICFVGCGDDDPFLQGGGSTGNSNSDGSTGATTQTYTITYILTDGLGAMQGEVVQQVKLGEAFTLNKLSRDEEYTGYWTYNGKEFKEGVWNLEENITLYSAWTPNWTGIY